MRPPSVLVAALCMVAISSGVALPDATRTPQGRERNTVAARASHLRLSAHTERESAETEPSSAFNGLATNDPMRRACALDRAYLVRLWRGTHARRSEDLLWVPKFPNYHGTLVTPGHAGPWNYLQNVPLVFYGPRRIRAAGAPLDRFASIVDVYPTVGRLLGTELAPRAGHILSPALKKGAAGAPKLVVVVVWDGVGRDVLNRWPGAWPTLRRLEQKGTSFARASIGSTPSNTPPVHSSLGTGTFPRRHGITGIEFRDPSGAIRSPLENRNPEMLEVTTFADQVDQAFGGASEIGMVGFTGWQLGMLGHGTAIPGGDADHVAIIGRPGDITGHGRFYSTPDYLKGFPGFERHWRALDRSDGRADGRWRGHTDDVLHADPAWARYETDIVLTLMRREGYGSDEVPDILLVNYKMTDNVGHKYLLDSPEARDVLRAQDSALARIVRRLERDVGDYVLIVSSDHGHTPPRHETGGFPVMGPRVAAFLDKRFAVPRGQSLVQDWSGGGMFLDREVARRVGATSRAVARALNDFTIRDSWGRGRLPNLYRERGNENVFSAVFPRGLLSRVVSCAFGRRRPPPNAKA